MLIYQLEYFRQLISYRASTASEEAEKRIPVFGEPAFDIIYMQ